MEQNSIEDTNELGEPNSKNRKTEVKENEEDKSIATYSDHIKYLSKSLAIYTDPATKSKFLWREGNDNWEPFDESTSKDIITNSEYYTWSDTLKEWVRKEQTQTETETEHFIWDAAQMKWLPKYNIPEKNAISYAIEDGEHVYTDREGVKYSFDEEKRAWFPKMDGYTMASYLMNYNYAEESTESKEKPEDISTTTTTKETTSEKIIEKTTTNKIDKEKNKTSTWFDVDPKTNTKVYVTNLPLDITLDEFTELMGKCGMIMRDPKTHKFKIKLYAEPDGQLKGDGLCDYIKVESVTLALNLLDEYVYRDHKLSVQRATFQMRGEYNPALKPKQTKKDKEKLKKMKEKLFDWRPEPMRGERAKNERVVIIKNLFEPSMFEKDVELILQYQNDLREECSKFGTVHKVTIYDRNEEGVAQVNMSTPEEADNVIQVLQGRFFGQRQLTAEHWDGKTKYMSKETEQEKEVRLEGWKKFLDTET